MCDTGWIFFLCEGDNSSKNWNLIHHCPSLWDNCENWKQNAFSCWKVIANKFNEKIHSNSTYYIQTHKYVHMDRPYM